MGGPHADADSVPSRHLPSTPTLPGTPRQGALAPSTRGVLRLSAEVSGDALDGLAGFSHLWVL
jgi:tRNA (Thr-GGU) A37 N-methylase